MQYGWIWADDEIMSLPMDFAVGDEDDEEEWDEDADWDDDEDDLDEEWDDEDEEDDEDWEELEEKLEEAEDESYARRRASRPEWN